MRRKAQKEKFLQKAAERAQKGLKVDRSGPGGGRRRSRSPGLPVSRAFSRFACFGLLFCAVRAFCVSNGKVYGKNKKRVKAQIMGFKKN